MSERHACTGRAALSELFRVESARVHGLVLARCGDRGAAEEITAQTFEAAAERFADERGHEVTPAWLTTVALRRLVDHWRRQGRRQRLAARVGAGEAGTTPGPEVGDDRIVRALDSLAPRQRAVVALRYLDDWSVAEIADGLQMSYRAAESLLARARRALRRALAEEGVDR